MATFSSIRTRLVNGTVLVIKTHQQIPLNSRIQTCLARLLPSASASQAAQLHSSPAVHHYRNTDFEDRAPAKVAKVNLKAPNWHKYNDIVYPPTEPGEPERPAEICHSRFQIKYAPKKLWFIACMIRGMSIEEALKQMTFNKKLGAAHIREVLEEAQDLAISEHNVEFKSNLWVCDSFVTNGIKIKGYRVHGRGRYGIIDYRYANYFVRLREGSPPKQYYPSHKSGYQKMEDYLQEQRARRIKFGL